MSNKETLLQEEEKMRTVYSDEPSHLVRGMVNALIIEVIGIALLVGVSYLLTLL